LSAIHFIDMFRHQTGI